MAWSEQAKGRHTCSTYKDVRAVESSRADSAQKPEIRTHSSSTISPLSLSPLALSSLSSLLVSLCDEFFFVTANSESVLYPTWTGIASLPVPNPQQSSTLVSFYSLGFAHPCQLAHAGMVRCAAAAAAAVSFIRRLTTNVPHTNRQTDSVRISVSVSTDGDVLCVCLCLFALSGRFWRIVQQRDKFTLLLLLMLPSLRHASDEDAAIV